MGPAAHGQDRHGLFPRPQPHRQTDRGPRHFQRDPEVSGEYFDKIACFCFTTQHLGPHESAEWPVVFFLDPALEKDESMARVDSITLSYTLFAPPSETSAPGRSADRAGPAG